MFPTQVKNIVEDLKRTRKAIVAIGCSFVQAQGAINDSLYSEYKWVRDQGNVLRIQLSRSEEDALMLRYPLITRLSSGVLDFTTMEYDNSFVHVLCNKYLNASYTPINLGMRGCGNRASIKELYMHPDIDWESLDEIIVLYVPSGLERFDFINDAATEHFNWWCMWPHYENVSDPNRKKLWEGYATTVYSEKFAVLEQITHAQELMTWCKAYNARLVVTPGFDKRYAVEFFANRLRDVVVRDGQRNVIRTEPTLGKRYPQDMQKLFPWDKMFKPAGHQTFADLMLAQEKTVLNKTDHYFQFMDSGSPEGWITACAHPSAKGHDLFAKLLHEHLAK